MLERLRTHSNRNMEQPLSPTVVFEHAGEKPYLVSFDAEAFVSLLLSLKTPVGRIRSMRVHFRPMPDEGMPPTGKGRYNEFNNSLYFFTDNIPDEEADEVVLHESQHVADRRLAIAATLAEIPVLGALGTYAGFCPYGSKLLIQDILINAVVSGSVVSSGVIFKRAKIVSDFMYKHSLLENRARAREKDQFGFRILKITSR